MAFPADFSDQQQYRMEQADRSLQQSMQTIVRGVQGVLDAKDAFVAQNLTALWPPTTADYVHRDRDASTRQEQLDISNFAAHLRAHLLGEGTSPITAAQASSIFLRYAK